MKWNDDDDYANYIIDTQPKEKREMPIRPYTPPIIEEIEL